MKTIKKYAPFAFAVLCYSTSVTFAQEIEPVTPAPVEENADVCPAPNVMVRVHGLKDRQGRLRVELYSDKPDEFLASRKILQAEGKFFRRVDAEIGEAETPEVCAPLPAPGRYTMAVLHDRNANGKLNVFSDGFGFPNNPKLGMKKPNADKATFTANEGETTLDVVMNYWSGFGAKPISHK